MTPSTPWLTFAFAINPARATCGDTLILRNGTYGDPSSTGKLSISSLVCTLGNELTITAENQRKAKILDDGTGSAVNITDSAYIVVDGIYAKSTDKSGSANGTPVFTTRNNHLTLRNLVSANPNRYANRHGIAVEGGSSQILIEDSEVYIFHRHCIEAESSFEVVARRVYCNPRGGKIPGGFGVDQGPVGSAAAVMTMYPCRDCILENSIADGTTNPLYLNEMNATYSRSLTMSGSKVLGSICYKCNYGNGMYFNPRNVADLNHTPQNITVRDNIFVLQGTNGSVVRATDCVGCTIDHNSGFGTGTPSTNSGILLDQNTSVGSTPAQNNATVTNNLMTGFAAIGINASSGAYNNWLIDHNLSNGNGTNYNPSSDPASATQTFSNNLTSAPNMGTCKAWVPPGAAGKGAGTGGSDIGATILYRYVNGVLTTTPLWDPTTGELPHGATDLDGTNAVAGESLFDFHQRVNVNTGECSFPAGYGGGGSGPTNPSTHQSGIGTTSASWSHTLAGGTQGLIVAVAAYDAGGNVGTINTPTGCSGQSITAISGAEVVSSPAYRRTKVFGITTPNTGSCTISFTTSGSVGFVVGESISIATMGSFGTPSVATALSSTPTVTVTAPPGEQSFDFLGAKCNPVSGACTTTLTVGSNQTLQKDIASTGDIRLATSNKLTNNGLVMSATMGGNNYWTYVAVPVLSSSPAPNTAIITQDAYQLITGYGDIDTANLLTSSSNTPYSVGSEALFRIRFRVAGSVAATQAFGSSVYCRKDADSFTRAMDTFGSNTFRLLGSGAELEHPRVPASGTTSSTSRTGATNFDGVAFLRDESSVIIVPSLAVGHTYEVEAAIVLNGSNNNVYQCQLRKDDGTQLGYTQTPSVTVRPGLAGFTR